MNEIGWTLLWASIEEFVSGPTKPSHLSSIILALPFIFLLVNLLSNKWCLLCHITGIILIVTRLLVSSGNR